MDCTRKKRDKFRVCLHSAALNGNYCQTIFDSVYIDLRLKNFFSLFVDTSIHVFRAHFLFSKLFSCNFVSSWIRKAQKCISTEKERRKAKLFGACLLECVCVLGCTTDAKHLYCHFGVVRFFSLRFKTFGISANPCSIIVCFVYFSFCLSLLLIPYSLFHTLSLRNAFSLYTATCKR